MTQIARLVFAWITVALFLLFGSTWLNGPISTIAAAVLFLWLFATMVWSAFGAIKIADTLAELLGEPLGSLVLTLTIICLEGVLVGIAMMTSNSGATIGRDTLFGANMIMINFAGGLALFLGGLRHREQTYNFQGTSAYLAVVITLSVLGFILPNYTEATPQGSVTNVQATGITVVTLFIYVTFLLIQIGRHKHFFEESGGFRQCGSWQQRSAVETGKGRDRKAVTVTRCGRRSDLALGKIPYHFARLRQLQARDTSRAGRGDPRPDRRLTQDDLGSEVGDRQSTSACGQPRFGVLRQPWESFSRSSSASGS